MVKGLSRIEWRVISISLLLMMLCAFLLANERALSWLGLNSGQSEIGAHFKTAAGDVRTKFESSTVWTKAKSEIRVGDSIFVGEGGRAEIELVSGARVELPSKAIFRLIKMEGIPCLDMLAGTFIWRFSGPQAVAIKGARATLTGRDAGVEITVDGGADEHKVKTLTGEAQLQMERALAGPDEGRAPHILPAANAKHFYIWRLEDFYSLDDQKLTPRAEPSQEVPLEVTLNWEHPSSGPFSLQLARTTDLTQERRFYSTVDPTYTLEKAFIGANYWRVAFASQAWSAVAQFTVEGRYLDVRVEPAAQEHKVNLRASQDVMLRWNFSSEMAAYIAELSPDAKFSVGQTESRYLTSPEFVQEFSKSSVIYARMRGVNNRQELTEWSPVARIVAR